MDPVFLAKGLIDAGGWGAFVILCCINLLGFIKGWVVPRFVYDQAQALADRLQGQLQRNTEALEALTDEVRWDARGRVSVGPERAK